LKFLDQQLPSGMHPQCARERVIEMKLVISAAAFWIAFSFADHALFNGRYVRLVTGFFGEILSAFALR
jgi:hypothetical protein